MEAERLAKVYSLEPSFIELVLEESDKVYGGVRRALLTLKNNILIANAGIDHANAPVDCVALWPFDANRTARDVRKRILKLTGKKIGVIITDSRTTPLRMGTIGLALGTAGFDPIIDLRGKPDIYGKKLKITRLAVADSLACAANILMGESNNKTPAVLVRGAPVKIYEKKES
ncbi:MAG: coenzyme F420-0:L-glutamate ligase, partial [Candidatus Bathyarchaeia archaeon]